jgi:hypothetical protein
MTHRIADTFYDALGKLTAQEQKAVKTTVFDFQMDPSLPGLSMHRVDRGRDPNFWTARVNRDIRMVIHKQDQNTLLAWVGHHDAAYRWAETRRIESHPSTGAIQIVEARETVEDIIIPNYVQEDITLPRLFAAETEETLLSWGIPTDWIDTVRGFRRRQAFDRHHRHPSVPTRIPGATQMQSGGFVCSITSKSFKPHWNSLGRSGLSSCTQRNGSSWIETLMALQGS